MSIGFIAADWPAPPGIRAGQTTRGGGVSTGPFSALNLADHVGDGPGAVAENRRRLREGLQLPAEPAWLRQVHGVRVVDAAARDTPEADASAGEAVDSVCAVLTADCLPVVFCSEDGRWIAAAHAGWRGLANGVLEATVAAAPCPPSALLAWFGAAIGPARFEVGPEVRAAFVGADPEAAAAFTAGRKDRLQADLYALARHRLERLGLTRIHGGGLCTASDSSQFFSFRREGACGRMATLIWRARVP